MTEPAVEDLPIRGIITSRYGKIPGNETSRECGRTFAIAPYISESGLRVGWVGRMSDKQVIRSLTGANKDDKYADFGCTPWSRSRTFVPEYTTIASQMNLRILEEAKRYRPILTNYLRRNYPKGTIYLPVYYQNREVAARIKSYGPENRKRRLLNLMEECCVEWAWTRVYEEDLLVEERAQNLIAQSWLIPAIKKHHSNWSRALDLCTCLLAGVMMGHLAPAPSVPSTEPLAYEDPPDPCDVGACGVDHS